MQDYGYSWRILRTSSLTDQIFIKAKRIRTIEENKERKIDEGPVTEYMGIINYAMMALIQLRDLEDDGDLAGSTQLLSAYDYAVRQTETLMLDKNHDYGEAWRDMRISSLTDLILMKILRIKQIEENKGETIVSEGIDANFMDIANYAIFALIKIAEAEKTTLL